MCSVYTGAFIRRKWLDSDGRTPFQQLQHEDFPQLDPLRAQNEIALINRQTGTVTYGLKSLTTIIAHRHPRLKFILEARIIQWFLQHLYSFISYNRKVIAAVKPTGRSCDPSFNITYRIAYLAFAWLITSLVLTRYTTLMAGIVPAGNAHREYLVCGGQMLFQGSILLLYRKQVLFDYLGNMMTVSLMGALALLPALFIGQWLYSPLFSTLYFLMIAGGMLLEHMRRMKLLGLNLLPSATWILYRLLVLGAILLF